MLAISGKEVKEEIRPSQTEVGSIFNKSVSDPHDRDVNVYKRDNNLLPDPFFMCLLINWYLILNSYDKIRNINHFINWSII